MEPDTLGTIGATILSVLVAGLGYLAKVAVKYINSKQDLIDLEYNDRAEAAVIRFATMAAAKAEEVVENAVAPHALLKDVTEIAAKEVERKVSEVLSDITLPVVVENAVFKALPIGASEKNLKKMSIAVADVIEKTGASPEEAIHAVHSVLGAVGLGAIGKKR